MLAGLFCLDTCLSVVQVLDAGVKVASNQVQYSIIDRRPELYMMELCERKGIALLPYGVLVSARVRGCADARSPDGVLMGCWCVREEGHGATALWGVGEGEGRGFVLLPYEVLVKEERHAAQWGADECEGRVHCYSLALQKRYVDHHACIQVPPCCGRTPAGLIAQAAAGALGPELEQRGAACSQCHDCTHLSHLPLSTGGLFPVGPLPGCACP